MRDVAPRLRARLFLTTLAALVASGCEPTGPATTHTTSEGLSLDARVELLERYVTFRRPFEDLAFVIDYQNNSGGLLGGPSEWDIRVVAVVPAGSIEQWVEGAVVTEAPDDLRWLDAVPRDVDVDGVDTWYARDGHVVGVDREARVVIYRALAR